MPGQQRRRYKAAVPPNILAAYYLTIDYAMRPDLSSSRKFYDAQDKLLCLVGKLKVELDEARAAKVCP